MSDSKFIFGWLLPLLCLCMTSFIFAQNKVNLDLDQTIDSYLKTSNPSEQYDHLVNMMSLNAKISLEQANQYYHLFHAPLYVSKNKVYPLLAHYIAADVLYYHGLKDSSLFHYLSLSELAVQQEEFMLAASGVGNAA